MYKICKSQEARRLAAAVAHLLLDPLRLRGYYVILYCIMLYYSFQTLYVRFIKLGGTPPRRAGRPPAGSPAPARILYCIVLYCIMLYTIAGKCYVQDL